MNNPNHEIAIIGYSGRFPGAESIQQFWSNLENGQCAITEVPPDRWEANQYYDRNPGTPGKSHSKWGGFLTGIDLFDPFFFGISPREAALMDPQQRLFLQEAWNAFENAAIAPELLSGRNCGVFVGVGAGDYLDLIEKEAEFRDGFLLTGNTVSTYAGRISYLLNLRGPCFALDTACSSALVAIHLACESIKTGKSEIALAGGSSVMTTPKAFILTGKTGLTSPRGRCCAFDDAADGYVLGEAVVAVVLKPLPQAVKDGDPIHGIIKASGINQDGRTNGLMAPNAQAQSSLQMQVLAEAGISAETISYIEAMATGTHLGDAIEVNALTNTFSQFTQSRHFCPIGSLKTNIGHSGQPSGVAGLIKVLLAMQNGKIPPSLNHTQDNTLAKFSESPFYVADKLEDWRPDFPKRAVINAFGHSGTNACLVVEAPVTNIKVKEELAQPQLLTFSAKTEEALKERIRTTASWFEEGGNKASLSEIARTLNTGRNHFRYRLAVVVREIAELRGKLKSILNGESILMSAAGVAPAAPPENAKASSALCQLGDILSEQLDSETREKALCGVAQFYAKGFVVPWQKINGPGPRISLPGYPFARERHWVKPGAPKSKQLCTTVGKSSVPINLFAPVWEESPTPRNSKVSGTLVIFDACEKLSGKLARHFDSVVRVTPGDFFRQEGNQFQIHPGNPKDYDTLFSKIKDQYREITGIVHMFGQLTTPESTDWIEKLRFGFDSVFLIAKSLNENPLAQKIPLLYLYERDHNLVFNAAVGGLGRCLQHELPRVSFRSVQTDFNSLNLPEILLNELSYTGAQEVSYTNGKRLTRELLPIASTNPGVMREDLHIVITGGAGGLGRIFAARLASEFKAKISLLGRSALSIEQGRSLGNEIGYFQADITSTDSLQQALEKCRARFGPIDGVIHSAGVVRDAILPKKELNHTREVLAPKIAGSIKLDIATRKDPLEFFVMFSSIASVIGNLGQVDYATANRFMDAFADWREELRQKGDRNGRTVSINWPSWKEGGMRPPAENVALAEQVLGLHDLESDEGWRCFLQAVGSKHAQVMVLKGRLENVMPFINSAIKARGSEERNVTSTDLVVRVDVILREMLAELLQMDPARILNDLLLTEYGVDSILFTQFLLRLNQRYELRIPPSVLIEHPTLGGLTNYLAREYPGHFSERLALSEITPVSAHQQIIKLNEPVHSEAHPIAIVGMAGRFPGASNVEEFWKLLIEGRHGIVEVPRERWDWRQLYADSEEIPGATKAKWGGFLEDVDKFDPAFFNLSPAEAELIDPQQRLLLETVWHAIENAGHPPKELWNSSTGVFVGAQSSGYGELLAGRWEPQAGPGLSQSILSNRISYFFNFLGPSETIDTACSSSAVALHRAVKSLQYGECDQAIAAGVNLIITSTSTRLLSQMGFLATDEKTRPFDRTANGYVRGEGVAAVLLKPLSKAIQDGNPILGLIKASATNHSGRSASLLAPNATAQANAIELACRNACVPPETLSYIEANGTGTLLGDSVEVSALKMALSKHNGSIGENCGIGSLKPNIGHLEAASGMAGLIKLLLCLHHKKLPPTLFYNEANPELRLDGSGLYIVSTPQDWNPKVSAPRRAGLHSYGFGGTNVFVVLEEPQLSDYKPKRMPLQNYTFARVRCWPELLKSKQFIGTAEPRRAAFELDAMGPENELLEQMRMLFSEILKIPGDAINVDEKFVRFGVDSVLLMQVMRRLKKTFGAGMNMKVLLEAPTLRLLAQSLWNLRNGAKTVAPHLNGSHQFNGAANYSNREILKPESVVAVEEEIEQALERIDQLSDQQVEELLARFENSDRGNIKRRL